MQFELKATPAEYEAGLDLAMSADVAKMLRLKACGWGLKRIARRLAAAITR
jgi:hypothetical protein